MIYSADRLGRDDELIFGFIKTLRNRSIRLISTSEGEIDLNDPDEVAMFKIRAVFANLEGVKTSKRMTAAIAEGSPDRANNSDECDSNWYEWHSALPPA